MKKLKIIALIIPFIISSCASSPYLKNYDCINVFLETTKLDKNKEYILARDKENNKQALRIFNVGEGPEHIVYPTDIDFTSDLFIKKHWKKLYNKYANDTIKRYWKKEDFPEYKFILESGKGLLLKQDFLIKYIDGPEQLIILSEPMYYMNKKYIMFYYSKLRFDSSGTTQVVIMKKIKGKWVVVKTLGDYIFS